MSTRPMSPLIGQMAEKVGISADFFETLNLLSVFNISKQRKSAFLHKMSTEGVTRDVATDLYERACGYANQLANIYRRQRHKLAAPSEGVIPTWESLFDENWLTFCDEHHLDSNQGPVAYLVELFGYAQELDAMGGHQSLLSRRPDLESLVLEENNTYQQVPMLDLVNEMLSARIDGDEDIDTVMATTFHPAPLPYDSSVQRIELVLKGKEIDYSTVCHQLSEHYPLWHNTTKSDADEGRLSMNVPIGSTLRRCLEAPIGEMHGLEFKYLLEDVCDEAALTMDELFELGSLGYEVDNRIVSNVITSKNCPTPKYSDNNYYGTTYIMSRQSSNVGLEIKLNTGSGHGFNTYSYGASAYARLNKFSRLQKAVDIPYRYLDNIVSAHSKPIDLNRLRRVGIVNAFRSRGVDFDFNGLVSFFNTQNVYFGLIEDLPLFDKLFNSNPDVPVLSIVEPKYINPWLDDTTDPTYEENWFVCNRICEGLCITVEDLKALCLQGVEEGVSLNFTVFWARYFHELVYLAELLKMPLRALLALLPMMSSQHENQLQDISLHNINRDACDVIMDLLTFSDWLKATELDVTNVLQWLTPASALTISSTDSKLINLTNNVQRQLPTTLLRVTDLIAAGLPTSNGNGDITIAEWEDALLNNGIFYLDNQGITVTPLEPVAHFEAAWDAVFTSMSIAPTDSLLETMNDITLSCFYRQNQLLGQELSAWLGCSASIANKLLSWVLTPTDTSTTVDVFLHNLTTIDINLALPTEFMETLYDMARHKSVVVDYFGLSDFSLGKLIEGGLYGAVRPPLNLALLYHLSRYQELLALTGDEEALWFGVQGSFSDDVARADYLAELMGWESSEIQHLFEVFTSQAGSGAMTMVELLHRYQAMSEKLNLNVSQLLSVRALNNSSAVAQWREVGDMFAISDKATQ